MSDMIKLLAVLGLGAALVGGGWAYYSQSPEEPETGGGGITAAQVAEFTEELRVGTVARVGQPIEGFEPSMFMTAFPGFTGSDFDNVDALIGIYRYQDGEVVHDLNGEVETHSAARAISDEGMEQLLINTATRLEVDLNDENALEDLIADLEEGSNDQTNSGNNSSTIPAEGEQVAVEGTITCLPHKGDGPHTMECAFGLHAVSGVYYGLSNLWTVAPDLTDTDVEIRVTGVLTAPPANEKYDIDGYIEVKSAERI